MLGNSSAFKTFSFRLTPRIQTKSSKKVMILRICIVVLGVLATAMSLNTSSVYGLWYLAGDLGTNSILVSSINRDSLSENFRLCHRVSAFHGRRPHTRTRERIWSSFRNFHRTDVAHHFLRFGGLERETGSPSISRNFELFAPQSLYNCKRIFHALCDFVSGREIEEALKDVSWRIKYWISNNWLCMSKWQLWHLFNCPYYVKYIEKYLSFSCVNLVLNSFRICSGGE